eukprot:1152094-Rhodomonas_salina.1
MPDMTPSNRTSAQAVIKQSGTFFAGMVGLFQKYSDEINLLLREMKENRARLVGKLHGNIAERRDGVVVFANPVHATEYDRALLQRGWRKGVYNYISGKKETLSFTASVLDTAMLQAVQATAVVGGDVWESLYNAIDTMKVYAHPSHSSFGERGYDDHRDNITTLREAIDRLYSRKQWAVRHMGAFAGKHGLSPELTEKLLAYQTEAVFRRAGFCVDRALVGKVHVDKPLCILCLCRDRGGARRGDRRQGMEVGVLLHPLSVEVDDGRIAPKELFLCLGRERVGKLCCEDEQVRKPCKDAGHEGVRTECHHVLRSFALQKVQ